jgi:hypothetical protein
MSERSTEPAPDSDPTVQAALPPATEAMGRYAGDKLGGAMQRLRRLAPREARADNRRAGVIAVVAGVVAVAASYLSWVQIVVAGHAGPGSLASGIDGRDGVTVLVVGALAAVVGVILLLGRGDPWLKVALFIAGGIVTIIGIVDIVDVRNKAEGIEERFGVADGVVTARVGIGLWMVLAAGIALLVAGSLARRPSPGPAAPEPRPPPVTSRGSPG